jgi:DNA adenine methylase
MPPLPFLKWAGGKRWLTPRLGALLGSPLRARLVEPFVGSGAAFFGLEPTTALLGDMNEELIATFRGVRDHPDKVIRRLSRLTISRTAFKEMRQSKPRTDVGRAARLIYLNRTGFNGLYRVNQSGEFNVPYGCKVGTQLCDVDTLERASHALAQAVVLCQDFRQTLKSVIPGNDLVYVDPPYTVKHNNNGFQRYNERIFTWHDQEELAELLTELAGAGCRIVISNANHALVRKLYPARLFHTYLLKRKTNMAANPRKRGTCQELLLISRSVCENRSGAGRQLESGL